MKYEKLTLVLATRCSSRQRGQGQSCKVRQSRRHGRAHTLERSKCRTQPAPAISCRPNLHLFRPFLGDRQPLHTATHLRQRLHQYVQRKTPGGYKAAYLRHGRRSVPKSGGRRREPVYPCHWRIRRWKNGEHEEGHPIPCVCCNIGHSAREIGRKAFVKPFRTNLACEPYPGSLRKRPDTAKSQQFKIRQVHQDRVLPVWPNCGRLYRLVSSGEEQSRETELSRAQLPHFLSIALRRGQSHAQKVPPG